MSDESGTRAWTRVNRPTQARTGMRAEVAVALTCAAVTLGGCAAQPPSDAREVRIGANLNIYDMYDNSRPWGSSYLVGPPMHHDGDESRVDDLRSAPPREGGAVGVEAADPQRPPASGAPAATLTTRPLPAVP